MPALLITGVTGFLGRAVAARAQQAGWAVSGTSLTQAPPPGGRRLDVRDERAVAAALDELRPDAILHCAYVLGGDAVAHAVNADGAAHVAAAAHARGIRLVHVSSDAIFRGDLGRALREDDPPDPVTAYGATKAAAELAVAGAHPGALIVRTSLLFGGPGQAPGPHEVAALDAARGVRDMTFYADEVRCPIQVDDLAVALVQLAGTTHAGPLHVAGADALDRAAFARLIVVAAGLDPAAIRSGPRPADRAGDCALDCSAAAVVLRAPPCGALAVFARAR